MGCTGRLCAAEQLVKAQRFHCKMVQTACGGKGMPDPLSPDDTVRPVTPPFLPFMPAVTAVTGLCCWPASVPCCLIANRSGIDAITVMRLNATETSAQRVDACEQPPRFQVEAMSNETWAESAGGAYYVIVPVCAAAEAAGSGKARKTRHDASPRLRTDLDIDERTIASALHPAAEDDGAADEIHAQVRLLRMHAPHACILLPRWRRGPHLSVRISRGGCGGAWGS